MKQETFWRLLSAICDMGEFIAAVPNGTASANIVGQLRPGRDGGERVLEKVKCHCHIHLVPENVARFSFTYLDAGFGSEPCVEVLTHENEPILKLYFRGGSVERTFTIVMNVRDTRFVGIPSRRVTRGYDFKTIRVRKSGGSRGNALRQVSKG